MENTPSLLFTIDHSITKNNERVFSGFGTVEVYDSEGERINVDAVARCMPKIMERGGAILDSHTNRIVGKILDWRQAFNPETGKEGIWLKGKIFNDFSIDDEVWQSIKSGEYTGFSLGGKARKQITTIDGGQLKTDIPDAEVWEFSVVREPANPPSTFENINYIAKTTDIQKPFAGYKDFDACVAANQHASNPEAYCAAIHHQATGKWPSEKTKEFWTKKNIEETKMEKDEKNSIEETPPAGDESSKKTPVEEKTKQEDEEKPTPEEEPTAQALQEVVEELLTRVAKLESKQETEEEEETEDEEEEKSLESKIEEAVEKALRKFAKAGVTNTPQGESRIQSDELRKTQALDWSQVAKIPWRLE